MEIISVDTRRRAWPTIPGAAEIARPLDSILRHAVLPNFSYFRIDVPKEPMGPRPAGRIRIVHDQSETLDGLGKIFDAQGRTHIGIFPPSGNALLVTLRETEPGAFWA